MEYKIKAFDKIYRSGKKSKLKYWFWTFVILFGGFLFLPWTQNIRTKGKVTTRYQDERTQQVQSPIAGKIIKWFVKEGDLVKKGDTILEITEIKDAYLDPKLIEKTKLQLDAKKNNITLYQSKAQAAEKQKQALQQGQQLKVAQLKNKLTQLNNKLKGEKAELFALDKEVELSQDQYNRQQKMFNDGLVSQTQLQQRALSYQNAVAKKAVVENKVAQTQQEIINNAVEQNAVVQDVMEKVQKIEGERLSSLTDATTSQGEAAKLENTVSNYIIRNNMYIVLAPQDGQIIQTKKSGIGELLKEGELITSVVPTQTNFAVELFVRPVDFPLIDTNQNVRFMFDGFPAVVFSGWPEGSYGTFSGKVVAFENSIGDNGMFRVLVTPNNPSKMWPKQLKVGSGAQAIVLLKDVPIWYELWRNINGFPPDFYKTDGKTKNGKESK